MAVFGMSPLKEILAHPFRALSALSVSILTAANLVTMTPADAGECGRNPIGSTSIFRTFQDATAVYARRIGIGFCLAGKTSGKKHKVALFGSEKPLNEQEMAVLAWQLSKIADFRGLPLIDFNRGKIATLAIGGGKPYVGADTVAMAATKDTAAGIKRESAPVVRMALADVPAQSGNRKSAPIPLARPSVRLAQNNWVRGPAEQFVAANGHKQKHGSSNQVAVLPPERPAEAVALRAMEEARVAVASSAQNISGDSRIDHHDAVAIQVAEAQVPQARAIDGDSRIEHDDVNPIEQVVVTQVQPRVHTDDIVMKTQTAALVGQATSFVPQNEIEIASSALLHSSFGENYSTAIAKPNTVAVAAHYPAAFRPEDLVVDVDAPLATTSSLRGDKASAIPQVFERKPVRDTLVADLVAAKNGIGKGENISATVRNVWHFVPRVPAVG